MFFLLDMILITVLGTAKHCRFLKQMWLAFLYYSCDSLKSCLDRTKSSIFRLAPLNDLQRCFDGILIWRQQWLQMKIQQKLFCHPREALSILFY